MPAASVSTPPICTNVSTRYSQSSVANEVANQVKFIHAHQIAKKIIAYEVMPCTKSPSLSAWCNCAEATLIATTNTRSKNSSSMLAVRCGSCGSRGCMRPRRNRPRLF